MNATQHTATEIGQATHVPRYVVGNQAEVWHLAERYEARGAVTGKLFQVYWRAACSHRSVGGCYGSTTASELPANAVLCRRCAKLAGVTK